MLGVLSATHEESVAVVDALSVPVTHELGRRHYHVGLLHGYPIVAVFSRWGKVAAAATATQLIARFGIDQLLFCGLAGAIQADLKIGDIVVGTTLVQHDMDARPLYPRYEIPLLETAAFQTDLPMQEMLAQAAAGFLREDWPRATRASFGIEAPRVVRGPIASGDQFFASAEQVSALRALLPETACVEMEGAAVAQVCAEYAMPFGIVRTLSDTADHRAVHDFPRFSREIGGQYSLGIVTRYLRSC
jgi:adenosylhomocysteine nucleosidase